MAKSLIELSKYISLLLRHDPKNLKIDKHGWVLISELVKNVKFLTFDRLIDIVDNMFPARFIFSSDGLYIRAMYGHSINIELPDDAISPPDILYHGTARDYLDNIFKNVIW